ncbi:MAG: OmpA family protein [Acidobacteria bacterium]|nr:MAG: OmpA family protein [Acidobacteriota bacterium]
MLKHLFVALSLVVLFIPAATGQAKDRPGTKDHPLFTRMPGFYIHTFEDKQFEQHRFAVAKGNSYEYLPVEGHFVYYVYEWDYSKGSSRPGSLQIIRNFQNAAKAVGGKVLFEMGGDWTTLLLTKDGQEYWVQINAPDRTWYEMRIVERQAMKQEVVANAEAFKKGLETQGHVEVPGIYFDIGKSEVKLESEAALKEMVLLLTENPNLKVWIVGHTDYTGALESNVALSNARAAAVVKALVSRGVATVRLAPYGNGPYAPVTSNRAEDGRAKNRRVEMVERP